MTRRQDLGVTLTETLRARAEQLIVTVPPFDPHRTPSLAGDEDPPEPGPRRWDRGVVLRAAAIVGLVALVAAVAVRLEGRGDDVARTRTGQTTTTPPVDDPEPAAPDGALIPSWLPDGMELRDVEWRTVDNPGLPGFTCQLFGDPATGRFLLVSFGPQSGDPPSSSGTPITVRGATGTVAPGPDVPGGGWTLRWVEDGADLTARVRGMTAAEAVTALDRLAWRSAGEERGFEAPADGTLLLQGEATPGTAGTTHQAEIVIRDPSSSAVVTGAGPAIPMEPIFQIRTATASETGQMSWDYLFDWFHGGRNADGTTQWSNPALGELSLSWPDGRTVDVQTWGLPADTATLDRLAREVEPGTAGDLYRLRAEADAAVAALPVVAAVDIPTATLEVHRRAEIEDMLCVRFTGRSGDEPDCGARGVVDRLATPGDEVAASVVVEGTWYVAVASTAGPPEVGPEQLPPGPPEETFAGEAGRDGGWRFVLVEVPPDVDRVSVGPEGIGMALERPR